MSGQLPLRVLTDGPPSNTSIGGGPTSFDASAFVPSNHLPTSADSIATTLRLSC